MNQSTKTRKMISAEYGFTPKTLVNKLKRVGVTLPSGDITPKYQDIIYNTLGKPRGLETD